MCLITVSLWHTQLGVTALAVSRAGENTKWTQCSGAVMTSVIEWPCVNRAIRCRSDRPQKWFVHGLPGRSPLVETDGAPSPATPKQMLGKHVAKWKQSEAL